VDDKLKRLMKEELITSLPHVMMSIPAIYVGVIMPQIRSQSSLVTHPTPISQHLGWQQRVTLLISRQTKDVLYPPYPMWYNTLPPFVPMDPNMYSMYYSRIKGPHPLIYGRKEKYVVGTLQVELMPPIECS
jgi:hypothetical protein